MSQLRQGIWWSGLHGNRAHVDTFFNTLPCDHARKPPTSRVSAPHMPLCAWAWSTGKIEDTECLEQDYPGFRIGKFRRHRQFGAFRYPPLRLVGEACKGPPCSTTMQTSMRKPRLLSPFLRMQTWGCERRWKRQFFATGHLLQKLLLFHKPQARDPLTEHKLTRIPGTDSSPHKLHLPFRFSPPAPNPDQKLHTKKGQMRTTMSEAYASWHAPFKPKCLFLQMAL